MHRHQQVVAFADFADARPFRVPAVRAVVAVRALRQAVGVPGAVVEDLQNQRTGIPADRPQGIRRRLRVAENAAGAGHVRELVAADDLPVLSVPLREHTGGDGRIALRELREFAVVGVDDAPLAGVASFAVVAGQQVAVLVLLQVAILIQLLDLEGLHVHLVQALFHRRDVDFIRGVREVPGAGRQAAIKVRGPVRIDRRHHAHVPLGVDCVGADEQLVRLAVDHAVRRRAADRLLADDLLPGRGDLIQLVARPVRHVGRVGDGPQASRPRHHRARAALALVVPRGEVRIDSAHATLRRVRMVGTGTPCRHSDCKRKHRQRNRDRAFHRHGKRLSGWRK